MRKRESQPKRAANRRVLPDQGFTLFEVLVAFLIAAMAVATIVHVASSAAAAARIAGRYDEAVSRAQSHLVLSSALPLVESDRQDDEADGFHWHVAIKAAAIAHPAIRPGANPAASMTLYSITVTMSWRADGGERAVQLSSARLGLVA